MTATGGGFGLLEQSIPRLGYTTARAEGDDVFQGDAVVMICPSRPATEAFRKRLVEYVAGGGRLLVIDAGLSDVPSTSNQILRPFGLSLDYRQPWNGELVKPAIKPKPTMPRMPVEEVKFPPGIYVESAWQVSGGTSVAAVHAKLEKRDPQRGRCLRGPDDLRRRPIRQGPGDGRQLRQHVQRQEPGQRLVAQSRPRGTGALRRALRPLRRLVKDEPIVVPDEMPIRPEPKIKVPLNRPGRRRQRRAKGRARRRL